MRAAAWLSRAQPERGLLLPLPQQQSGGTTTRTSTGGAPAVVVRRRKTLAVVAAHGHRPMLALDGLLWRARAAGVALGKGGFWARKAQAREEAKLQSATPARSAIRL